MISSDDLLDDSKRPHSPLHRSVRTSNFASLRVPQAAPYNSKPGLTTAASSRRSQSSASENSQILYMSTTGKAKHEKDVARSLRRSLSTISNSAGRRFDGSADEKIDELIECSMNANAYNDIDREIIQWQYVCGSGRPYWWSPVSKNNRLQKLQRKLGSDGDGGRLGVGDVDDASKRHYISQRRAVTDSYLADPTSVQDLAHLIAVQLLGACFTLPPDSINAVMPQYTRDEDGKAATIQARQLISSLRMHTSFRYSPCFGHQARSTSPVQISRYDGPNQGGTSSPCSWRSKSQQKLNNTQSQGDTACSTCSTPNIGTSSPCSRRSRTRRRLNNTQGSLEQDEEDEDSEEYIRTCCDNGEHSRATSTAWYRREGVQDHNSHAAVMPRMSSTSSKRRPARTPECSLEEEKFSGKTGHSKPNYRLQPVLRSEPHHVFIQPVRELVVKRWRNFRRRFSGSLHSPLPTRTSDEVNTASEASASDVSVPELSTDAKIRRLRAQERGDIHSSSMDSTPHYNTPKSGQLSPEEIETAITDKANSSASSLTLGFGDSLTAAASLVAIGRSHTSATDSTEIRPSLGNAHAGHNQSGTSSTGAIWGSEHTRSDMSSLSVSSKPNTPVSTYSAGSPKPARRNSRRSMLSEVCTLEDFQTPKSSIGGTATNTTRSNLSAAGSTLATPEAEVPPSIVTGARPLQDTLSSPGPSVLPTLVEVRSLVIPERPRMSRMSTNGTTIFTPNDDGVEIDGLPAGPCKEVWAAKGGRRERTYL